MHHLPVICVEKNCSREKSWRRAPAHVDATDEPTYDVRFRREELGCCRRIVACRSPGRNNRTCGGLTGALSALYHRSDLAYDNVLGEMNIRLPEDLVDLFEVELVFVGEGIIYLVNVVADIVKAVVNFRNIHFNRFNQVLE
jgi:hypothetical protein